MKKEVKSGAVAWFAVTTASVVAWVAFVLLSVKGW